MIISIFTHASISSLNRTFSSGDAQEKWFNVVGICKMVTVSTKTDGGGNQRGTIISVHNGMIRRNCVNLTATLDVESWNCS